MFNFGGGPGIRVHQFGGARPQRRPRNAQNGQEEEQGGGIQNLIGMLPILLFFIIPLLTSLFGGDTGPGTPNMTFDAAQAPYTHERSTPDYGIKYFVRPQDIKQYSSRELNNLDRVAEQTALRKIRNECDRETVTQRNMREDAQGWFSRDEALMAKANAMEMPHCKRWAWLMENKKKSK